MTCVESCESRLITVISKQASISVVLHIYITLFSLGSLMISVPLIVGILLTCLTPDIVIPEVWITDKPPSFCPAPSNAKTDSCTFLVTSSHAGNEDCITINNSNGLKKLI